MSSTVLFTRLAAIAQREEDVEQYFALELTNQPQALFKDVLMRKPDKSSLRKVLLLLLLLYLLSVSNLHQSCLSYITK